MEPSANGRQRSVEPATDAGEGQGFRFRFASNISIGCMLLFVVAVILFGVWSNTGRIAGPEHYADGMANLIPFGYAFTAGIVASVNPCGFLMLPAFIGYQLGDNFLTSVEFSPRHLVRATGMGIVVTLGFVTLFSVVGSVIAAGGNALVDYFPWSGFAIGIVLSLVGLWLFATGRPLGLAVASRVAPPQGRGFWPVFLYGICYGAVSLSCTLPVFLVVVGTSLTSDGLLSSVAQFVSFSLGMGSVIIAVSLGATSFRGAVGRGLGWMLPSVHRLGAILLAGAGLYLVLYWVWMGEIFN